jgi:hypothetical protein
MKPEDLERLGDYLDGALPEPERRRLETRLAEEPDLAAELESLRAIVSEAAALPKSTDPPDDLWPGVERRIRGEGVIRGDFRPRRRTLVAVAAAAAIGGIVLTTAVLRFGAGPTEVVHPTPAVELDRLEVEYAVATREILGRLEGGDLDPETVELLRRNLEILEEAVEEIRRALDENPESARLHRMLAAEYRRRGAMLRRTAALTDAI